MIGILVGIANIIPGVSGGSIAFIFKIYQELLNALKEINFTNLGLLLRFQFKKVIDKLPLPFLINFFTGVLIGGFAVAKLLEITFKAYPKETWAFFFGLILASVIYLIKEIKNFNLRNTFFLLLGLGFAVVLGLGTPLQENANPFYLVLCGILAISSMIIPGISGSYVLILLGNYPLALNAVTHLNFAVLIPIMIGCGIGFLIFVRLISWLFERFAEQSTSTVIGFVAGSLLIIWPWKNYEYLKNLETGELILKKGNPIVVKNINYLPEINTETLVVLVCALLGFAALFFLQNKLLKEKK